MDKTIEERLNDLVTVVARAEQETFAGVVWGNAVDCVIISLAYIIEPWDTALEVMKVFVDRELDTDGCSYCDNDTESGHSTWCLVPRFQAAIAQMEGD